MSRCLKVACLSDNYCKAAFHPGCPSIGSMSILPRSMAGFSFHFDMQPSFNQSTAIWETTASREAFRKIDYYAFAARDVIEASVLGPNLLIWATAFKFRWERIAKLE